jgi:adenine-specific DNA-methyltransferase
VTTNEVLPDGRTDTGSIRKARGAFFTPAELCDYIVDWAIQSPEDRVLEPSCGEAAFLLAAVRRLKRMGASPTPGSLNGIELHEASSRAATALIRNSGWPADVTTADFFTASPQRRYSAVIGNPPYVRYQDFARRRQSPREGSGTGRWRAAHRAGVILGGVHSSRRSVSCPWRPTWPRPSRGTAHGQLRR